LWTLIEGIEVKRVAPIAQIIARTQLLLAIGVGRRSYLEEKDVLFSTIINNWLDNNVVPHVQACLIAHSVWTKLTRLYKYKDEMTKMYLRDKLQTFKVKENENTTKHLNPY
jgi:hypothetical protein